MSRHPVTPIKGKKSDLGRHLARQTARRIGLVDFVAIANGGADAALASSRASGSEIISLDVLDQASLVEAGRLMWDHRGERLFAVGSQGVEQALVAYWQSAGLIPATRSSRPLRAVKRIACISGSCSPVTAEQMSHAARHGFDIVRLDATRAVDEAEWIREIGRGAELGLAALSAGRDPLLMTAAAPTILRLARSTRRSRRAAQQLRGQRPDRRRARHCTRSYPANSTGRTRRGRGRRHIRPCPPGHEHLCPIRDRAPRNGIAALPCVIRSGARGQIDIAPKGRTGWRC